MHRPKLFALALATTAFLNAGSPARADLEFRFTTGTLTNAGVSSMVRLSLDGGSCIIDFNPASPGNSTVVYTTTCSPDPFSSVTLRALSTDGWYLSLAEVNEGNGWIQLETTPAGYEDVWLDQAPYNQPSSYGYRPFSSSWTFVAAVPDNVATYRFTSGTIENAGSSGTFRLSLNNGQCTKDFTGAASGSSKTVTITCPGGTPALPVSVTALSTDGWFITEAEIDTTSGWSLLSPQNVWVDGPPLNLPSSYGYYPAAETQTFQ